MIKGLRILLIAFFLFAGSYHFINPSFYFDQIPDYFSNKLLINYTAGSIEILLAVGVAIKKTRFWAVIGILLLMLAFVPTHWLVIQKKWMYSYSLLCAVVVGMGAVINLTTVVYVVGMECSKVIIILNFYSKSARMCSSS